MFHQVGRLSATYPWIVCLLWIVLGVVLSCCAPPWDAHTEDDDIRFMPERFTSLRAYQIMEKAFPKEICDSKLIFAIEREDAVLSEADFLLVERIVAGIEALRDGDSDLHEKLGKVASHRDGILGYRLTSADRHCTLIQVALKTPYLAIATQTSVDKCQEVARKIHDRIGEGAPKLYTTGAAGIGRDMTRAAGTCLEGTTWATVILVIVVLLLVYRAPLMALVPLLTIAISCWVALKMLCLMTAFNWIHLVNISKVFAIVILYGAGTDYCLFLVSRYREELGEGYSIVDALARSVGGVGEALAASAGTVMVGLGLMATAEFAKVRYAGPAIALCLGVALVASLTLTPAMLRLLGRKLFWPGLPPTPTPHTTKIASTRLFPVHEAGFWERISRAVARHPAKVWFASVAILAPLVWLGLQVHPSYRATAELPPETESLQGLAAIQRHYTAGEIGPITVLLSAPVDWNTREGRLEIDRLTRGFACLPNVAEVRSLTQPLGGPLPNFQPVFEPDRFVQRIYNMLQPYLDDIVEEIRMQANEFYLARAGDDETQPIAGPAHYVARLDVVTKSDPFAAPSTATLRLIQTWLKTEKPTFVGCEVRAECFGITSCAADLAELTETDRARVNTLVLAAIFGILLLLVRRLWLAIYLLVTVLASYYAALGATTLAGVLWTGHILPEVDWRVPFFLFTILVAVGEDYNILLVSRAMEEQRRHGLVEGMRRALAKTGGAITSCGLIMAGTFATLMLAGLGTLLQIGFALAFGVLVDTFLVRPFLVPAFAILCWKAGAPAPAASLEVCTAPVEEPAPKPEQMLNAILGEFPRAA